MTAAEQSILATFRRFGVGPNTMLCFQTLSSEQQKRGMTGLLKRGFVVKERPKHAYSLTNAGYAASKNA
jgi:hypothetical protein